VLCYHRVVDEPGDPLSLAVHPDRFAAHVRRLAEIAEVVSLAQIRDRDHGDRRVALTFDDAYADTAECAAPILESAGLPATVFVPTMALQPDHEFWWERLVHLVLDVVDPDLPALDIELAGRPLRSDVRTAEARLLTFRALNHRFSQLDPEAIDAALDVVAEQLGGTTPRACPRHRKMTSEQVRALDADGLFDVGGHSRTHPVLAALDKDEQRDEIAGGRRELETLLRRPVTSFAYPHGHPGSFDATTRALVREAGYGCACTTIHDRVRRRTDSYRMPRFIVVDWNGDEFAALVETWLAL
jgi:peptidoglycan/xylan/chitin deacetylase (PgdA/CDA1 family)